MTLKPIVFCGNTRVELSELSLEVRRAVGWQLQAVQGGLEPDDWKPMSRVGIGVKEIRIHRPLEYRVIYIAQLPEAVYVLRVFEKKTEKTPLRYIEDARRTYAEIKRIRRLR